jgi:hypothetical protein
VQAVWRGQSIIVGKKTFRGPQPLWRNQRCSKHRQENPSTGKFDARATKSSLHSSFSLKSLGPAYILEGYSRRTRLPTGWHRQRRYRPSSRASCSCEVWCPCWPQLGHPRADRNPDIGPVESDRVRGRRRLSWRNGTVASPELGCIFGWPSWPPKYSHRQRPGQTASHPPQTPQNWFRPASAASLSKISTARCDIWPCAPIPFSSTIVPRQRIQK